MEILDGMEAYFDGRAFEYDSVYDFLAGCIVILSEISSVRKELVSHPKPTRESSILVFETLHDNDVVVGNSNILNALLEWAKINLCVDNPEVLFHQIYLALSIIDNHFSKIPPHTQKTIYGILTIGYFWSYMAQKCASAEIDILPFSDRKLFQNLDLTRQTDEIHWISSQGLGNTLRVNLLKCGFAVKVLLCSLNGTAMTLFDKTSVLKEDRFHGFHGCNIGYPYDQEPLNEFEQHGKYLREIENIIDYAIHYGAHILLLPELCITEDAVNSIKSKLNDNAGSLCIIVAGSIHKQIEADWYNATPVLINNGDAFEEYTYLKTTRFDIDVSELLKLPHLKSLVEYSQKENCQSIQEDIEGDNNILLINSGLFGIFGTLICRDVLDDYDDIARELKIKTFKLADHISIPSMNPGHAWFLSEARGGPQKLDSRVRW